MADDILIEIRDRKEHTTNAWSKIREEAATDMAYVSGNPWTADDDKQRKGRPTIAPEEMGQYFNQVINQLWANPRGMKFAPVGNGANDKGAQFYQNKAREIEYRSHAKIAYTTAASDAIQRSYGFVEVTTKYASPRSANQEIWIEPVPDPDMISPDPDAIRSDSGDMKYCFQEEWQDQSEFKREHKGAKVRNFSEWASSHPSWISGTKVLKAKYWTITTRPRKLLLVQPPAPPQPNRIAPQATPAFPPVQLFEDEWDPRKGGTLIRELRDVDYPQVKWYMTNGVEILDEGDWPGKYIPIISCYGKVLYVPKNGRTERQILSMTRFGRAPWKAYCYAASQELEVLSMIPKAPFMVPRGTFPGVLGTTVQESMHVPKAYLEYEPRPNQSTETFGPPQHADYPAGQHLQALEIVKEGFRRAIQSAMGSNFLPTQAQKRNEKSGVALDKMQQAATTGTFHFVNNYEDMIRQVGVVCEDLIDKIHDYDGETATMEADLTATMTPINSSRQDAISTKGDYLVTVSTGPNSDSEREDVREFTESLVSNLAIIAQVSGPKQAAAVLALSIRLRNGGPLMDKLADILEPPEYKRKDGDKPPDPEKMALQGQMQHLQQQLQAAAKIIETEEIKIRGQKDLKAMDLAFQEKKLDVDSHVKLDVAALGAKVDRLALLMESQRQVSDHLHSAQMASGDAKHELGMAAAAARHQAVQGDRAHEQDLEAGDLEHQQALEAAEQGVAGQLTVQAAQPQDGASA